MIDTNTIKDRILSFAYQGKLVEPSQLSNDNIEAIHACIKGYIPVSEEEHLIAIPKEWKWTRLGYVTSNHGQVTPSDTFSYIDVGTLDNVNHRLSSSENIVEAKDAPSRAKKVVEAGDVIYSTVRPYLHNICIIDKDFSYTPIASTAFCVMHANEEVLDNKFLFYWLLTKEFDKYSNGDPSKGALYPAIGEKDLLKGAIPLPAISEQKAIVEMIETVFEILDKIFVLQNQYAFNQEALKCKLIDAAIQGKLTEQRIEDGTAEELREEASDYKEILAKEGILKNRKNKDIKEISDDECPFELPSSWNWFRLGEIIEVFGRIGFRGYKKTDLVQKGQGAITMSPSNISKNGEVSFDSSTYISWEKYEESPEIMLEEGDVVLVKTGSTYGKCGIINELPEKATINPQLAILKYIKCNRKYLYYVLRSTMAWTQYESFVVGAATPTFSQEKITNMLIPMPPMAEQERIVSVLDKIFEEN